MGIFSTLFGGRGSGQGVGSSQATLPPPTVGLPPFYGIYQLPPLVAPPATPSSATPTFSVDWTTSSTIPSQISTARSSSATYYNSSGTRTSAASGTARIDYIPGTLVRAGLLPEEQRTNIYLRSDDAWNGTGVVNVVNGTLAQSAVNGADGTTKLALLQTTSSGANQCFAYQNPTMTSGATYTYAADVKLQDKNQIGLLAGSSTTNVYATVIFDFTTGKITQTAVGSAGGTLINTFVIPLPNGIYRVGLTASMTNANSWIVEQAGAATGNTFAANGTVNYTTTTGQGILFGGMMVELGASPTSHIVTTTASVTRSADIFSSTDSTLLAAKGWIAEVGEIPVSSAKTFVGVNTVIGIGEDTNNLFTTTDGGTLTTIYGASDPGPVRAGFAWDSTPRVAISSGGSSALAAANTAVTPTTLYFGNTNNGASGFLNGHIRMLACYSALDDTQLAYLTPPGTSFTISGGAVTGDGSATGSGAATAVGASTANSQGASSGSATVTAVGASTAQSLGSAAGSGAATAVGASTAASVGSAAGLGSATAVGASTARSAGASAGSGAATAVVASTAASVGSSAGSGTATAASVSSAVGSAAVTGSASAVGEATATAIGSVTGFGTATAVGSATAAGTGASSGSGAATAIGASTARSAGSASGSATAAAFTGIVAQAVGSGTATAVGASTASAIGASAGTGTATAASSSTSVSSAIGASAGTGTAAAIGAGIQSAVGSSAGSGTASGVGTTVGVTTVVSATGTAAGSSTSIGYAPSVDFSDDFGDDFATLLITLPEQNDFGPDFNFDFAVLHEASFNDDFNDDFAVRHLTQDFNDDFSNDFAVHHGIQTIVSGVGVSAGASIVSGHISTDVEAPPVYPVPPPPVPLVWRPVHEYRRVQAPRANRVHRHGTELRKAAPQTMNRTHRTGAEIQRTSPLIVQRDYGNDFNNDFTGEVSTEISNTGLSRRPGIELRRSTPRSMKRRYG